MHRQFFYGIIFTLGVIALLYGIISAFGKKPTSDTPPMYGGGVTTTIHNK